MSVIDDIAYQAQDRLLEPRGGGIFWSLQDELRVFVAEGMAEATAVSVLPQTSTTATVTVAAGTSVQAMPSGAAALIRVAGATAGVIRKVSAFDLDQKSASWENDTGATIQFWFPIGATQWGIYPKPTQNVEVELTYVANPPGETLPLTGQEASPFNVEFDEAFADYAYAIAAMKEGTGEFQQSLFSYQRFMDRVRQLLGYSARIARGSRSVAMGTPTAINPLEKR